MKGKVKARIEGIYTKLDNGGLGAKEILLFFGIFLLFGVIIGIFISPKNMMIGCNNGSHISYGDEFEDEPN